MRNRDLSASLKGLEKLLDEDMTEHEFSFSREHGGDRSISPTPMDPSKVASSGSNSTNSTKELSDSSAHLLKSLTSQLLQIDGKRESYACNMALKKAKDKLQGLALLERTLVERKNTVEEQERRLLQWQGELVEKQRELDERTKELNRRELQIDEYIPRIQLLEQQVAPPKSTSVSNLSHLSEIESELKRTAALLESRTYDLIREERDLQRKETDYQARHSALLTQQELVISLKSELETGKEQLRVMRNQVENLLEKTRKNHSKKEAELNSLWVLDGIVANVMGKMQGKYVLELREKRTETEHLLGKLREEIEGVKELAGNLRKKTEKLAEFRRKLRESEEELNKKEAGISAEIALLRDGKADTLLKRREEALILKEKAFNEKLSRLKEAQNELKQRELQINEAQNALKMPIFVPENRENSREIDENAAYLSELKAELTVKGKELEVKEKALEEREKLQREKEEGLIGFQQSVEQRQEQLKSIWAGLASAASLIGRVKEGPESEEDSLASVKSAAEVTDFTESFRVRQQAIMEHFANVDREKQEMSATLREFLGTGL